MQGKKPINSIDSYKSRLRHHLLMDEPSGSLDSKSEQELLRNIETVSQRGKTVVIITHSPTVAAIAQRIYQIQDGRLKSVG